MFLVCVCLWLCAKQDIQKAVNMNSSYQCVLCALWLSLFGNIILDSFTGPKHGTVNVAFPLQTET